MTVAVTNETLLAVNWRIVRMEYTRGEVGRCEYTWPLGNERKPCLTWTPYVAVGSDEIPRRMCLDHIWEGRRKGHEQLIPQHVLETADRARQALPYNGKIKL